MGKHRFIVEIKTDLDSSFEGTVEEQHDEESTFDIDDLYATAFTFLHMAGTLFHKADEMAGSLMPFRTTLYTDVLGSLQTDLEKYLEESEGIVDCSCKGGKDYTHHYFKFIHGISRDNMNLN